MTVGQAALQDYGDQGKILRVTTAGNGELWYDTGQSHVTGLAVDAMGRLLAGSEPNGILYRISGKDKAFVLYDATLPEIRSIVPLPGTKQRKWLEANAAASDLKPSKETLAELDRAFPRGVTAGTRYPESQMARVGI